MAVPAWVERLRSASFESPTGIISEFKIDVVSRVGGKKASSHEILNADIAIPQDQGNRALVYPIEAYFTGEDCDIDSGIFFESLREDYSIETPGILHHPVWGDIPVMPFEFQESTNLVSDAGIFRATVEFRPIPLTSFPTPDEVNESEIVADVNDLEETMDEANGGLIESTAAFYQNMASRVRSIVNIVKDKIGPIISKVQSIQNEFEKIQRDIESAIAAGTSILLVVSQVNSLIRKATSIEGTTLEKISAYFDLVVDIAGSFDGYFTSISNDIEKINNAIMRQSFVSMGAAAIAEAAMFTDFETRDAVGVAISNISDAVSLANEGTAEIYKIIAENSVSGIVSDQFAPDHNTESQLGILYAKAIALLLIRSFDLKAKQIITLYGPSDPITLTWKYYNDLDKLEFSFLQIICRIRKYLKSQAGRK